MNNVLHIRVNNDCGIDAQLDHVVVAGERGHLLAVLEEVPQTWEHLENTAIFFNKRIRTDWHGEPVEVPAEVLARPGRVMIGVSSYNLEPSGKIGELANSTVGEFFVKR